MNQVYEVQDVIGQKLVDGQKHYRILWKNYPRWQSTWQPQSNLPKDVKEHWTRKAKEKMQRIQAIKERSLKKKQLHYEQSYCQAEITDHFIEDNNLIFRVRNSCRKRQQFTRDQLCQKHPKLLAKYYIQLAKQKKIY